MVVQVSLSRVLELDEHQSALIDRCEVELYSRLMHSLMMVWLNEMMNSAVVNDNDAFVFKIDHCRLGSDINDVSFVINSSSLSIYYQFLSHTTNDQM